MSMMLSEALCMYAICITKLQKSEKKENDDNDVTGEASNVSVCLQTCLLIFCSHHSGDLSALVKSCTQSSSCTIVINFWLRFLSCGRDVLWPGILSSSVQVFFACLVDIDFLCTLTNTCMTID